MHALDAIGGAMTVAQLCQTTGLDPVVLGALFAFIVLCVIACGVLAALDV
ncbi:MAG TPA: hypothetical protein VF529_07400 [Solirubrobacteraceae bacterium]|jgi:hypothetical protein